MSTKENHEIIYKEISSYWSFQKDAINVIHTKSNWIAAIDGLLISSIFSNDLLENYFVLLIMVFFIASLFFAIRNFWPQNIVMGPDIDELVEKKDSDFEQLISELNDFKKNVVKKNYTVSIWLNDNLKISTILLVIGIIILFVRLIINL